ncbi:SAM-dependent methyltransferase [Nocardiopsis sp. TSRI0078]|uniref:SAM-dependent methyltransferase n=1 Tax=unclassified Nocardiopsis TaxID=2649073 RepID=UPI00093E4E87|nr:SAM-dependent methyltransferase [Nocardiopsis sp. TSRI0078]OKI18810.1 SAM-dependent methyltransferase [Nocardiopsis sp. TSRI0078]
MPRFSSPDFLRQAGGKHVRANPPPLLDLAQPSVARLHSFHLKGKDHFEVDRDLAAKAERAAPGFQDLVLGERAFLQRAVRHLSADLGIRQFIQFGAGLPAPGDPHEIAHESVPGARVVYATDDPVVLTHHRALLRSGRATTAVDASLTRPGQFLRSSGIRGFVDLDEPVGLLLTGAVSHTSDADTPAEHIAVLREALAPGSHMVLSHYCRPDPTVFPKDAARAEQLERVFLDRLGSGRWRSRKAIEAFFEGWEVCEPGVIEVQRWRTLPVAPPVPGCYQMPQRNRRLILGGIGRI